MCICVVRVAWKRGEGGVSWGWLAQGLDGNCDEPKMEPRRRGQHVCGRAKSISGHCDEVTAAVDGGRVVDVQFRYLGWGGDVKRWQLSLLLERRKRSGEFEE